MEWFRIKEIQLFKRRRNEGDVTAFPPVPELLTNLIEIRIKRRTQPTDKLNFAGLVPDPGTNEAGQAVS